MDSHGEKDRLHVCVCVCMSAWTCECVCVCICRHFQFITFHRVASIPKYHASISLQRKATLNPKTNSLKLDIWKPQNPRAKPHYQTARNPRGQYQKLQDAKPPKSHSIFEAVARYCRMSGIVLPARFDIEQAHV